jgi:hypothetical protein
VNHNLAGYMANSLMAWDYSEIADDVVSSLAIEAVRERPWASHCYLRRVVASDYGAPWPYNLFVMVHARDVAELVARENLLSGSFALRDFVSMRTVKEYKKNQYRLAAL